MLRRTIKLRATPPHLTASPTLTAPATLAVVLTMAAAMLSVTPAMASILSTTPAVVAVPAPTSVQPDDYVSDTEIRAFDEQQCITLADMLVVDSSQDGPVPTPPISIPIAAGTEVSCHFLHFDPSFSTTAAGTVTFDADILGVIVYDQTLDASDSVCGLPATSYPTGTSARGAEQPGDSVIIDPNYRTVHVDWAASYPGDQIRVITRCTPSTGIPEIEAKLDRLEPQLLDNQAALEAKLDHLQSQIDELLQILDALRQEIAQIEAKLDARP